jgi:hypothetical protein
LHQCTSGSESVSEDSDDEWPCAMSCGTASCCLNGRRVSSTLMYSGTFATASRCRAPISKQGRRCEVIHITVNLRPAVTSTTCGSWTGADLRNERCSCRNCMAPFGWRKNFSGFSCCDCLRNKSRLRKWSVQECRAGYCEPPHAVWLGSKIGPI